MALNRVRWSVLVLLGASAVGAAAWWRWPSPEPSLRCHENAVGLDDAGLAQCGLSQPLPAAQALTIGQKLDLNRATAEELALVPGVGRALAERLVDARQRLGGFTTWAQVDAVSGVGASRLERLEQNVQLGEFDAGL